MPDIYLNGAYVPDSQAHLAVDDRGTMFGDGVYEAVRYYDGCAFEAQAHLDRLQRSLAGIRLDAAAEAAAELPAVSDELVRRQGLCDAKVYWQVTRGSAPRNHRFPRQATPTVLAIASSAPPLAIATPPPARVALLPDRRWCDVWIKALTLLPNVLALEDAIRAGHADAILHRDGQVSEATASNVMIVRDGELWTPPTDGRILAGITRAVVLELARDMGITVREQAVSCEQLCSADEVLLTGTTTQVRRVTHVQGQPIGGESSEHGVTDALAEAFARRVTATCGLGQAGVQ